MSMQLHKFLLLGNISPKSKKDEEREKSQLYLLS